MEQKSEQLQVMYIDGCKITIKYSDQQNPTAVKNIKDALISGVSAKKN